MKKVLFLFLALCSGLVDLRFAANLKKRIASGFQDDFSAGTLGERIARVWMVTTWPGPRLAPEGTYCLTGYVSVTTPSGPLGLLPGQQVKVVREAGSRVVVTALEVAGARELEVPRASLTDDLDLAGHIAAGDRAAQRQFRAQVAQEETERERVKLQLQKEAAADLAAVEQMRLAPGSGAGIGGRVTVLHQGSSFHGGGYYSVPVPVYYGVPVATSVQAATTSNVAAGLNFGRTVAAPTSVARPPVNNIPAPRPTPPAPTPSPIVAAPLPTSR